MLILGTVIKSILARLLTAELMEWALLYIAGLLVKSTATPYDDELLAKIKETLANGK